MDKRWIYILIILIVGVICLFFVVDSSTTLGSANVYVNKFTVTVPSSFNVDESGKEYTELINRHTGELIHIEDFGKETTVKKVLSDQMDSLNNDGNIALIETTQIKIGENTYPAIHYQQLNNSESYVIGINLYNHTFLIKDTGYKDIGDMKTITNEIINTLVPDYKQKQD